MFNLSCDIIQNDPLESSRVQTGLEGSRAGGQQGRRAGGGGWWLSRGSQGLGPMWMWASPAASWTQTTRLWGPKHRWPPTKCTHMVSEPQGNQSIANPFTRYAKHMGNIQMYILKSSLICIYQCVCWFGDVMGLKASLNLLKLKHFFFFFFFFGPPRTLTKQSLRFALSWMQNVNNCWGQGDVSQFDSQINTLIWIPDCL